MDQLSKWTLRSLTIGPQLHETNTQFWEEAVNALPPLPSVDNVTIIYIYPTVAAFNVDCWEYFDHVLTRRDLFPALESVRAQQRIPLLQPAHRDWRNPYNHLRRVRERGLLFCKSFVFDRDHEVDLPLGAGG